MTELENSEAKIKISITDSKGSAFFGPGPLLLLQNIGRHKSISKAARAMNNMSYAKAQKMLKTLQQNFSEPLITTRIGGAEHGGAELTAFARKLIRLYTEYNYLINEFSQKEYHNFINKLNRQTTEK